MFRIAIGLCVVLTIGMVVATDSVEPLWLHSDHGGIRPIKGTMLVRALGGATPRVIWSLVYGTMGAGLLLALGLGGRLMAFVTLQLFLSLADLNGHAGGSYDELLLNALWLVVLSPCTATLSLDCRMRTGRWLNPAPQLAIVRVLIVYQLVLMYWTTGLQKLSAYWTPGGGFSALYYILQQPSWHRMDMSWLAYAYPLTQVGTAVTWFWEVLAPLWGVAFWYRLTADRPGRARHWFNRLRVLELYAATGLFFHVAVFVFMDVGPFSPISAAYYVALLSPETVRTWLAQTTSPAAETASG